MNERIKLLAEQTGYIWHASGDPQIYEFTPEKLAKFAELIVQECISIVDEQKECLHEEQKYWHDRDYGYALAVDDASMGIKKFFGVEE